MRSPLPVLTLALLAFIPLLGPATAAAGGVADVEIYDRSTGSTLPVHRHRGKLYVAGEPNHRYEIRLRNRAGQRVLAVTSVDGINVISGETASEQQSGYVLNTYESLDIEGWRKSLDDVAAFYFTSLPDSYAARTGRPDNVGVIGVALFRERDRCCVRQESPVAAPAAPYAENERDGSASAQRAESKLGTGHGEREHSAAQYVDFERASRHPDETIVIYYDSRRNLIAQGVLPRRQHLQPRGPTPFPSGFVPDP